MAVQRAQQRPAGGRTVHLGWLIAFVVLWLGFAVAFFILLSNQSSLTERADNLEEANTRLTREAQEADTDRSNTIALITGDGTHDLAIAQMGTAQQIRAVVEGSLVDGVAVSDPLLTVLQKVYSTLDARTTLYQQAVAAQQAAAQQNQALIAARDQARNAFDQAGTQLTNQLAAQEASNAALHAEKDQSVEDLNAQLAEFQDSQIQALREKDMESAALRDGLARLEKINKAQQDRLKMNRPPVDPMRVAWQADGTVNRALPGDSLVYIDIGKSDNLILGLRFQVHSPNRRPGPDGAGKATIMVVAFEDDAAECEILSQTPGDPIVIGDRVANAIFDRNRKFKFVVAGQFDMDYDGVHDLDGGDKIKGLVEMWHGRVVGKLDATTDFLVLGQAPPTRPVDPNADPNLLQRAQIDRAAAEAFRTLKQEAQFLGIPILTQAQFLAFIGYSTKDSLPLGL